MEEEIIYRPYIGWVEQRARDPRLGVVIQYGKPCQTGASALEEARRLRTQLNGSKYHIWISEKKRVGHVASWSLLSEEFIPSKRRENFLQSLGS